MSGEIEAAGAAATAGLAAGALEKGRFGAPIGDGVACANCGAAISGAYCTACGQPTHVHRTLGHFIEEAFHGLVHFDAKAWRTLPLLAFRPGTLTFNYIHGKRARYISPVALFLFTVFLMFFVFALMGQNAIGANAPPSLQDLRADVAASQTRLAEAEAFLSRESAELARLQALGPNAAPGAVGRQTGALAGAQGRLTGARSARDAAQEALTRRENRLKELREILPVLQAKEAAAKATQDEDKTQEYAFARETVERALASPTGPPAGLEVALDEQGDVSVSAGLAEEDGLSAIFEEIKAANRRGAINVNTGNKKLDAKLRAKLDNPELAWYKIQNTAYKFSFLLVPISLPFLWLMFFWKRGVTLFNHTVFALYSLSFVSLALIVLVLVSHIPFGIGAPASEYFGIGAVFALPAHMFFQLKGGYGLKWLAAAWRTLLLLVFALISLIVFLGLIFVMGLLG